MKKIYFLAFSLIASGSMWAQNGELSNGGFENWSSATIYDYTTQWGNSNEEQFVGTPAVLQSTDAQDQTYAVDLLSVEYGPYPDTTFGYVYQGSIGSMGPDGGISYTDAFDEVRVYYKADLSAGDTAFLMMLRFQSGVMIEQTMVPVATSTQATYAEATISVPNTTQDELFIGFLIGNPFSMNYATPGSWIRLDNVRLYNGGNQTAALPDPSFEQWSSATIETPDDWYTLNDVLAGTGVESAIKSIDAYAGTYSIEMTTVLSPGGGSDTINSFISNGPINIFSGNPFMPAPYAVSPTTISGAYKYTPSNADQGGLQLTFLEAGNIIGTHFEPFSSTSGSWVTFSSNFTLAGTPDSMSLIAFSGDNPGSTLNLDELSLSGGNVGITEFASMASSVYPNPAKETVMVKADGIYTVAVYDLSGNEILSKTNATGTAVLDVRSLSGGAYVLRLRSGQKVENHKLIIE